MQRPRQTDVRIVLTGPADAEDSRGSSPFDAAHPDDLVFCCFFKTLEERTEFLDRLRAIAARSPDQDADRAALNTALAAEYVRLQREGDSGEAFFTVVRWWIGAMRCGYHVYSLKVGFAPYATSCIVSFRALETETLRRHATRAIKFLEREKSRILDAFGLTGWN